jgi:hypothetical protein
MSFLQMIYHLMTHCVSHRPPQSHVYFHNDTNNSPGELQSVDGYMNIALEKTAEYVNGTKRREYGDAFVRGNNGKDSFIIALLR